MDSWSRLSRSRIHRLPYLQSLRGTCLHECLPQSLIEVLVPFHSLDPVPSTPVLFQPVSAPINVLVPVGRRNLISNQPPIDAFQAEPAPVNLPAPGSELIQRIIVDCSLSIWCSSSGLACLSTEFTPASLRESWDAGTSTL